MVSGFVIWGMNIKIRKWQFLLDPEGSLSATTVVLVLVLVLLTGDVVARFRKMPKALLIRNFAYTFVTSFPTDLPS